MFAGVFDLNGLFFPVCSCCINDFISGFVSILLSIDYSCLLILLKFQSLTWVIACTD